MTTFKAISPVLMQVLSIWKPGQVKTPSIKMHRLPACPCLQRNKVEEMQSALDDSLAAAAEAASAPGGNIELVQQLSERLNQAGRREAAYVEQLDVLRAECWGLGEQLREAHLELEAEGELWDEGLSGDDSDWQPPAGQQYGRRGAPPMPPLGITPWKRSDGTFEPSKLRQLVELMAEHNLRLHRMQSLLYAMVSLFTDTSVEELHVLCPMPSHGTIWTAMQKASFARQEQLHNLACGQLFSIEADEGPYKRKKNLMVLIVLPTGGRFFVSGHTITSTSAACQLRSIECSIADNNWQVLGVKSGTGRDKEYW